MVHECNKKGIPLLKPSRAVKARFKTFRIFLSTLLLCAVVAPVPGRAIETTKASALVMKEGQKSSLSFRKSPSSAQADPCLLLLHASRLSPGDTASSQSNRRPVGKNAVPVALGLFLGVRIALGPKEVVKPYNRVNFGPEIRTGRDSNDNYALSIAAYRSCKNEHALSQSRKNNNNM